MSEPLGQLAVLTTASRWRSLMKPNGKDYISSFFQFFVGYTKPFRSDSVSDQSIC